MLYRILILLIATGALAAEPQESVTKTPDEMLRAISQAHVDANMPPEDKLRSILERDLKAYTVGRYSESSSESLKYWILGMKQVGIGWPRLYVLMQVDGGSIAENAGIVSAIAKDQERFEIEHFLTFAEIKAKPEVAREAFPSQVFGWLQEAMRSE